MYVIMTVRGWTTINHDNHFDLIMGNHDGDTDDNNHEDTDNDDEGGRRRVSELPNYFWLCEQLLATQTLHLIDNRHDRDEANYIMRKKMTKVLKLAMMMTLPIKALLLFNSNFLSSCLLGIPLHCTALLALHRAGQLGKR